MGVQFGVWLVLIFVQYAYPSVPLLPKAPLPITPTDILTPKFPVLPEATEPVTPLALLICSIPVFPEATDPAKGCVPPHPPSLQVPSPQPDTNHLKWLKVE